MASRQFYRDFALLKAYHPSPAGASAPDEVVGFDPAFERHYSRSARTPIVCSTRIGYKVIVLNRAVAQLG